MFSVAGDGGTADIGMAGISGAAERNDDGVYFCFDNEAYMNTGIQRSSQTPGRRMDDDDPRREASTKEGYACDNGRPWHTLRRYGVRQLS